MRKRREAHERVRLAQVPSVKWAQRREMAIAWVSEWYSSTAGCSPLRKGWEMPVLAY